MLKRNRYLLHGRNNTKKITAVARTNRKNNTKIRTSCCCTDKTKIAAVSRTKTTRRGRYRHKAGGEGNKGAKKKGGTMLALIVRPCFLFSLYNIPGIRISSIFCIRKIS